MFIFVLFLAAIKDLSNEKLVKDKEIRRQHVFRLLKNKSSDNIALKAQEATTVTAWIQAPYNKGEYTLRLLFYYALSSAESSLKYRLVRHNWKFNIHECLHSEVTCVLSNSVTGELGLNVDVRNENKLHHPLMSELYINSLALYCDQFQLNKDKFYCKLINFSFYFNFLTIVCFNSNKSNGDFSRSFRR